MDVELEVAGDLDGVPADAGIAVYRTVQEGLANAARHTPGARSVVSITVGPVLAVRVRTTGGTPVHQPGVGAGLLGMRERAVALGGWGAAGPDGDGWLVEVELPPTPASQAVR
jgi:signal transduction histidine kinase